MGNFFLYPVIPLPALSSEELSASFCRALVADWTRRSAHELTVIGQKGIKAHWSVAVSVDFVRASTSQWLPRKNLPAYALIEYDWRFGFSFSEWASGTYAAEAFSGLCLERTNTCLPMWPERGLLHYVSFRARRPWHFMRSGEPLDGSGNFVDVHLSAG